MLRSEYWPSISRPVAAVKHKLDLMHKQQKQQQQQQQQ
jgi:hypothetical protein